jgi:hypothetical protein
MKCLFSLGLLSLLVGCETRDADVARPPDRTLPEPARAEHPRSPLRANQISETGERQDGCSTAQLPRPIDEERPLAEPEPAARGGLSSPYFTGGRGFFRVRDDPAAIRRGGEHAVLKVHIEAPTHLAVGSALNLKISFVNATNEPIIVVRPLDGSLEHMGYPTYDLYLREHASDAIYRYAFVGQRCGNVNGVGKDDYITIAPDSSRDDVVNGWADHLKTGVIGKPGRYSMWLVYSFCGFETTGSRFGLEEHPTGVLRGVYPSNLVEVAVR